jgi:hypothetical protein
MPYLTRFAALFQRLEFRLALLAWATAVAVQPGTLQGDTMRRLFAAHSLWTTGEPTVSPYERGTVGYALVGRGGKLYVWSGIGQSLVMMPADIVATGVASALRLSGEEATGFRCLVVAYLTFPLIAAATLVVAYRLLEELGFSPVRAVLGCLGLLFGSTFLVYCQDQQENSLIMLLVTTGTYLLLRWLDTDSMRDLVLGIACFASNLLIRITTLLDAVFLSLFIGTLLVLRARSSGTQAIARPRAARFLGISALTYAIAIGLDRLYHFARFASWTGTYNSIFEAQYSRDYGWAPDWMWSGPFWEGFLGFLVSPYKSIFIYDPLLILLAVFVVGSWARARPIVRLWLGSLLGLLLTYVVSHARLAFWDGGPAWGSRYVLTPVWLMVLVGPPLVAEAWSSLGWPRKMIALSLIGGAILIQFASVAFPSYLETGQSRAWSRFVLGRRFVNIVGVATGRVHQWGLDSSDRSVPPETLEKALVPNLVSFRMAYRGRTALAAIVWRMWVSLVLLIVLQLAWLIRSLSQRRLALPDGPGIDVPEP